MCRVFSRLLLALSLVAGISLAAQQTSNSTNTLYVAPPRSEACPIDFNVSRHNGLVMHQAKDGDRKLDGESLLLKFGLSPGSSAPSSFKNVVRVEVTVHGGSGKPYMLPAGAARRDDLAETFKLQRQSGTKTLWSSDIQTEKVSAVSWVEVDSILYADGSSWKKSSDSQCKAAPDLLVQVDALAAAHQQ